MTISDVPAVADGSHLSRDQQDGWQDIRTKHTALVTHAREFWHTYALPQAKALGDKLKALKATYDDGKRGPNGTKSSFIEDAENFAGVKRTSVYNYISLSDNWELIQSRLQALPDDEMLSISGALRIISDAKQLTGDKSQLEDAADSIDDEDDEDTPSVVDADAEVVGEPEPEPKQKRRYSDTAREVAITQLAALKAIKGLPAKVIKRIDELLQAVEFVLSEVDKATAEPEPEWSDDTKDQTPTAVEEPATPEQSEAEPVADKPKRVTLPQLYPKNQQGWEMLAADVDKFGSDAALAEHLGIKGGCRSISGHRAVIKKAIAKAPQTAAA